VKVPELELELSCGTLGGMVTTVEGLIVKICEGRSASLYSPILSFYDAKMLCTHLLKLRRGFESDMCLCLPLFFFFHLQLWREYMDSNWAIAHWNGKRRNGRISRRDYPR
jgi:hypothetical protein